MRRTLESACRGCSRCCLGAVGATPFDLFGAMDPLAGSEIAHQRAHPAAAETDGVWSRRVWSGRGPWSRTRTTCLNDTGLTIKKGKASVCLSVCLPPWASTIEMRGKKKKEGSSNDFRNQAGTWRAAEKDVHAWHPWMMDGMA